MPRTLRHHSVLLGLCTVLALLLLPDGSVRSGEPEFTINFGSAAPEGTPWANQLKDIQQRIQRDSDGRIKVKLFLGGVMGGEVEMVQDIIEGGRLQAGGFSTASVAEGASVPALQLPELPFLFQSDAETDHILDKVLYEPMKEELSENGLFLQGWAINGWRSFYTKTKPIKSLADLRENKMRTQESKVHKEMYKAFGVQAVALPTTEVLDALNRDMVDGFDNTSLFGQASGWFQPTKYYTLSRHIFQPAAIVYSQDFFDELPADLQKVVAGDRLKDQALGRRLVRELEGELLDNFREMGLTVYEPTPAEMRPFRDAAQGVHSTMRSEVGGSLLDKVNAELKKLRSN
ncbi:MAG: TRAP transporter substrate-binding protein DctP [Myxococcota bacterium]|nr:TRAP transporter substrate-binding protein DctP [Myxococcota bacterium]